MAVTRQIADNDPARAIAKMAEAILKRARRSDVDAKIKYEAVALLEGCAHPDGAIPPPRELIELVRYLMLPDRDTIGGRWQSQDIPDEPLVELRYRAISFGLGFKKSAPGAAEKIMNMLIPFEIRFPPDPSGYWPSTAPESEVAEYLDESVSNVRRWRRMPRILQIIAQARSKQKE